MHFPKVINRIEHLNPNCFLMNCQEIQPPQKVSFAVFFFNIWNALIFTYSKASQTSRMTNMIWHSGYWSQRCSNIYFLLRDAHLTLKRMQNRVDAAIYLVIYKLYRQKQHVFFSFWCIIRKQKYIKSASATCEEPLTYFFNIPQPACLGGHDKSYIQCPFLHLLYMYILVVWMISVDTQLNTQGPI